MVEPPRVIDNSSFTLSIFGSPPASPATHVGTPSLASPVLLEASPTLQEVQEDATEPMPGPMARDTTASTASTASSAVAQGQTHTLAQVQGGTATAGQAVAPLLLDGGAKKLNFFEMMQQRRQSIDTLGQ